MTIEEAEAKQDALEALILNAVNAFQKETTLIVDDLGFECHRSVDAFGKTMANEYRLNIRVEL